MVVVGFVLAAFGDVRVVRVPSVVDVAVVLLLVSLVVVVVVVAALSSSW